MGILDADFMSFSEAYHASKNPAAGLEDIEVMKTLFDKFSALSFGGSPRPYPNE